MARLASGYLSDFFGRDLGPGAAPRLDPACVKDHPAWEAGADCWSAAAHYKYIKTPIFLAQNRFDANQAGDIMGADWWPIERDQRAAYIRYFGRATMDGIVAQLLNSSKPGDGCFVPSCYQHTGNLNMRPDGTLLHGVTYAQALHSWVVGDGKHPHRLVDDCAGEDPCNPKC